MQCLYRNLVAINSPFNSPDDFKIKFEMPNHEAWTQDILTADEIFKLALWEYEFVLDEGKFSWSYKFKPYSKMRVEGRQLKGKDQPLLKSQKDDDPNKSFDANSQNGIGKIKGKFFVFDLYADTLNYIEGSKTVTDYLKENNRCKNVVLVHAP